MDRSTRLATESIPKLLFSFSLPAIVAMAAQAVYNVVDRIFVGRAVGDLGIAAVTVSLPPMLILLSFGMLFGFGAAALVSIRLGEGNREEAERVLGTAVVLLALASVILTTCGLASLDWLSILCGASAEVSPLARQYLQIIILGTAFQVMGFGLNALIRGEGNPRTAMITILVGVLLNIVLAPVFIFCFGWGVRGAALATVLSQAVSAAWVVAYFVTGRSLLRIRLAFLKLKRPLVLKIIAIGSPHFLIQVAASVMNALLNHQLNAYGGDLAVSTMGVLYAVFMMVAMPVFGINQGAQPIIGFNYGANRFDRAKKTLLTAILAGTAITATGFTLAMFFPGQIVQIFTDSQDAARRAQLVAMGTRALRISMLMMPIISFQIISASYFQAVGRPKQAVLLAMCRQVILLMPTVFFLPRFFGLDGIWAAFPTSDLMASVITGSFLLRELRRLDRRHVETLAQSPLPDVMEGQPP